MSRKRTLYLANICRFERPLSGKAAIQILPDIDFGNALAGIHAKKYSGVHALFQEAPLTSCAVR